MRFEISENSFSNDIDIIHKKRLIMWAEHNGNIIKLYPHNSNSRHTLVAVYAMLSKKAVYTGTNSQKTVLILFTSLVLL